MTPILVACCDRVQRSSSSSVSPRIIDAGGAQSGRRLIANRDRARSWFRGATDALPVGVDRQVGTLVATHATAGGAGAEGHCPPASSGPAKGHGPPRRICKRGVERFGVPWYRSGGPRALLPAKTEAITEGLDRCLIVNPALRPAP
jgi:hypothetical protein